MGVCVVGDVDGENGREDEIVDETKREKGRQRKKRRRDREKEKEK